MDMMQAADIAAAPLTALTPGEQLDLRRLEAQIRLNLNAFLIVANSLVQIRDSRLYRAEFVSFEEYLDKRWDMTKSRAYRLITAAQVAEVVSPIGNVRNEWAARQLADLEPEAQKFVYAVAQAKSEGAPTAKVISAIRRQLTEATITGGYLDIGDGKPVAFDAAITQDAYETMQRQKQHIADNSSWDRLTTFEITVSEAAQRLEEAMVSLDSSEMIKISIYIAKG